MRGGMEGLVGVIGIVRTRVALRRPSRPEGRGHDEYLVLRFPGGNGFKEKVLRLLRRNGLDTQVEIGASTAYLPEGLGRVSTEQPHGHTRLR